MPLGIVSNDQFNNEVKNSSIPIKDKDRDKDVIMPSPIITSDVITLQNPGRHPDVPNVPQSLRKILGEEVVMNGLKSAKSLADSLGGLSQPTLSTYARGDVSPHRQTISGQDLAEYMNGRKTKVAKKALNKLNLALEHLDDSKMLGLEARELSGVAKDMAIIVKQMEPSEKKDDKSSEPVQFHIYAPQVRNENHYDVITAKDNY